jgi:hypothetical protein
VHLESAFYRFVARAARILEVSAIEERIATLANLLQQLIGKALSEASAGAGSLLFILRHPEHTDNLNFQVMMVLFAAFQRCRNLGIDRASPHGGASPVVVGE